MNFRSCIGFDHKVKLKSVLIVCFPLYSRTYCISSQTKTYYEILGLNPNCTTKEIKEAYHELCKEVHPDAKPNNKNQHRKFVELNEAYTILAKPHTRKLYDQSLTTSSQKGFNSRSYSHSPFKAGYQSPFNFNNEKTQWRDETIFSMRNKDKDKFYKSDSYYGIKGLKRVGNVWIVFGCLLIIIFGIGMHYTAFRLSLTFSRKILDEKDKRHSLTYSDIRDRALKHGKQQQVERFREKVGLIPEVKHNKQDTSNNK